jgi:uncharacterized hydrophobic protein (TIGR00271 family)
MDEIAHASATRPRRSPLQTVRDVANPATVKGTIAVLAGVALVVLPDLTLTLVELVLGAALVANGGHDIWVGLTGRSRQGARFARGSGSRLLGVLRGLAGIGVGIVVLVAPRASLTTVLALLGVYLVIRGTFSVLAGVLGRDQEHRAARLTVGVGGVALGVLALAVPDALTSGVLASGAVLACVVGGILLAHGLRSGSPGASTMTVPDGSVAEMLWQWVRTTDVGASRREALADTLYFEEPGRAAKVAAWWVMLLLSVAIATFAVLQDSTAVVIGAMLIAPLMTPILGLAGALVNGWRRRTTSSTLLVLLGVVAAVGLAYLISAWVPALVPFDANSQIISRVSPTFVDMLIAVSAGAAGAFATVNARVASSIAGVAIAVALVPPLGVVGVSLENQRWDEAWGSLLLFLTNFVSIVLAAAAVFVLSGFAESTLLRSQRRQIASTLAPFGALALVVLVPLVFTAEGILVSATQQNAAQQAVDDWLGEDTALRLDRVTVDGDTVTVELAGAAAPPDPAGLQSALSDQLGTDVRVELVLTPTAVITVGTDGSVETSSTAQDGSP